MGNLRFPLELGQAVTGRVSVDFANSVSENLAAWRSLSA